MQPFYENAETDAPLKSAGGSYDSEQVQRAVKVCFGFIRLAQTLDDLVEIYGGRLIGRPPRLILHPLLTWEFQELESEPGEKVRRLLIRRICE